MPQLQRNLPRASELAGAVIVAQQEGLQVAPPLVGILPAAEDELASPLPPAAIKDGGRRGDARALILAVLGNLH